MKKQYLILLQKKNYYLSEKNASKQTLNLINCILKLNMNVTPETR